MTNHGPVILELAPLPREQVGPFLLLGLEKTADKELIEASWAKRLIWARKGQIKTPLEDVNWAREVLSDNAQRTRADAASLNLDTIGGVLRRLTQRFEGQAQGPVCQPIDVEKDLSDYEPLAPRPDLAALRQAIQVPDVPQEWPVAEQLLKQWLAEPLDPWQLRLPSDQ